MDSNFFDEVIDELCNEYEVEGKDAKTAVETAQKDGIVGEDGDAESLAATIYDEPKYWLHLQ